MVHITFSQEALAAVKYERFHHPHPRVQQKMWAIWFKACELPHHEICRLLEITANTLTSYLKEFRDGGLDALRVVRFLGTTSDLDKHRETIEAHLRSHPPATALEARAEIARLTGITRSPTQVREFMRRIGMKCR